MGVYHRADSVNSYAEIKHDPDMTILMVNI